MTIDYRNGVAIGEIVFYVPVLAVAILLAIRHGFGRSSGWFYLIIFGLVRIVGACFQLATIGNPTNTDLYIGVSILQNIGLSPLELTSLGLLSRVLSSINRSQPTIVTPRILRLVQVIVMVGLILGIVGGIDASSSLAKTGVYVVQSISKVGLGLFIGSFVIIVIVTILISFSVSHAEHGEKRLLAAVGLSLPFLLVRLVYSSISTFTSNTSFNSVSGNVTIFLCMALIEELIIVVIYEACGLTLQKAGRYEVPPEADGTHSEGFAQKQPGGAAQAAAAIGRRTIIGRLIMGRGDGDVEMQSRRHGRRHRR
jgi:hypothetical protein